MTWSTTQMWLPMEHELLVALGWLGGLAILAVMARWCADLVWIAIAAPWTVPIMTVVLVVARHCLIGWLDKPSLSLIGALLVTVLIVRPTVDLLTWFYDLLPVGFSADRPFVEFERWDDYRDRLRTLFPAAEWDYLRHRLRAAQGVAFDETLEFEDAN